MTLDVGRRPGYVYDVPVETTTPRELEDALRRIAELEAAPSKTCTVRRSTPCSSSCVAKQ
jgi:hypothetical protein